MSSWWIVPALVVVAVLWHLLDPWISRNQERAREWRARRRG